MPKRPPRVARELPVPRDLRGAGPDARPRGRRRRAVARRRARAARHARRRLASISSSPIRRTRSPRPSGTSSSRSRSTSTGAIRWLAEVARVLAPHGSAYVCGFSEILADVKARSAKPVRGLPLADLVLPQQGEPRHATGAARTSRSSTCAARTRSIDVDAVRVPYNGHTTKYPARVQAVSSQYGARRAARSLGAEPARRQAARRDRDPGDLQRHDREDRRTRRRSPRR